VVLAAECSHLHAPGPHHPTFFMLNHPFTELHYEGPVVKPRSH
jgi:hypothetical protein